MNPVSWETAWRKAAAAAAAPCSLPHLCCPFWVTFPGTGPRGSEGIRKDNAWAQLFHYNAASEKSELKGTRETKWF